MDLSDADRIWNRAAMRAGDDRRQPGGGRSWPGDDALAALLRVHGPIMNGGLEHALEVRTEQEWFRAVAGFRYFSLDRVAALLQQARRSGVVSITDEAGDELDTRYSALIPNDQVLGTAFERKLQDVPDDFAPVESRDP